MKRVLLLLLFLPLLAVAQKDSIKTFKIGECTPVLAGKFRGSVKSTLSAFIADLRAYPKLELAGCGDSAKIISCNVRYIHDNMAEEFIGNRDSCFAKEEIDRIESGNCTFLVIREIEYELNGKKYYLDKKVVLDMAGQ